MVLSTLLDHLPGLSALGVFHCKTYLASISVPKGRRSGVRDLTKDGGSAQACGRLTKARAIAGGNEEVDK